MKLLRRALFLLLVCMSCMNVHAHTEGENIGTACDIEFEFCEYDGGFSDDGYTFYAFEDYQDTGKNYLVFTKLGRDYTYDEVSGDTDPRLWTAAKYDGYNIEFIADYSISRIPNYAFYNTGAGELNLPEGLSIIDEGAFYKSGFTGDLDLTQVMDSINKLAFSECTSLTGGLALGGDLNTIGEKAFSNTPLSGTLELQGGLDTIGDEAFYGCTSFSGLEFNNGNNGSIAIGKSAFNNFGNFIYTQSNLVIPSCVKSIGENAFGAWAYSNGTLTIEEGVKRIEEKAFYQYDFKGNLNLPTSLEFIGEKAFCDCFGFTGDLIIPEGVLTVENSAFYNDFTFSNKLTLPSTLTTLGDDAFSRMSRITRIESKSPLKLSMNSFSTCNEYEIIPTVWMGNNIGTCRTSATRPHELLATVTFDANGGDTLPTDTGSEYVYKDIEYEGWVGAEPTRTDYKFMGWYTDKTYETKVDFETAVFNQDTTLYAGWSRTTIITFKSDNSALPNRNIEVLAGDAISTQFLKYDSHNIVGIYTDAECQNEYTITDKPLFNNEATMTLYLKTEIKKYKVTLNLNDGEPAKEVMIEHGGSLPTVTRDGYGFNYWYTGSKETSISIVNYDITSDLEVSAQWTKIGTVETSDGLTFNLEDARSQFITDEYEYYYYIDYNSTGKDVALFTKMNTKFDTTLDLSSFEIRPWATIPGYTEIKFANTGIIEIPDYFFYEMPQTIGDIVIPEGVTRIGKYAFYRNLEADKLVLPSTLETIDEKAFQECGFKGDLIIPDNVESIGDYTFCACNKLDGNLQLPKNLKTIGNTAFGGCSRLTGNLIIPDGVENIDEYAFDYCTSLGPKLYIPNSLKTVGNYAFNRLYTVNQIEINTNKFAKDEIFGSYYYNGTQGMLPQGVIIDTLWTGTSCESYKNLSSRPALDESSIIITSDGMLFNKNETNVIKYNNEFGTAYYYTDINTGINYLVVEKLKSNVNSIAQQTEYPWTGVVNNMFELKFSSTGIDKITDYAFSNMNCTNEIVIPDTVTEIQHHSFEGSSISGNLVIPDSVEYIGNYAFYNTNNLYGKLKLGNSLKEIGDGAFYYSNLSGSLIMPDNLTKIGESAFESCSEINGTLALNNKLKTIGANAFAGTGFIGNLFIPESVEEIGDAAFFLCNQFSDRLTISNKDIAIGDYAFVNMNNIKRIEINSDKYADDKYFGFYEGALTPNNSTKETLWLGDAADEYKSLASRPVWDLPKYKVSFETNGGNTIADALIYEGELLDKPIAPIRNGYKFVGWYDSIELDTEFNFEQQAITSETTLYAKWVANKPSTGSGNTSGNTSENNNNSSTDVKKDEVINKDNSLDKDVVLDNNQTPIVFNVTIPDNKTDEPLDEEDVTEILSIVDEVTDDKLKDSSEIDIEGIVEELDADDSSDDIKIISTDKPDDNTNSKIGFVIAILSVVAISLIYIAKTRSRKN